MHHLKLKSAVSKYQELHAGGATPEQLKEAIAADEKQYSAEEINKIIEALEGKVQDPPPGISGENNQKNVKEPKVAKANKTEAKPASPNDHLELAGFDYREMKGETFKQYVELVGDRSFRILNDDGEEVPVRGQLREEEEFDFVLHKAVPIMKARFPGVKDTPYDFVGITMKEEKPIHKTRIAIRTALEMNAQILNAHSRAGHGKYYFLAKP